ncbi:hypothetical protein [uncultured Sphingomonas sp.]|uniref:hypothetical protein n=1 Tax=uncultured Sphingomonas sp. TaxID=158754 RepID=UPI00260EB2F8|nr:hypothetical protein [uncultured Sphingomonas sp.]
MPRQQKLKVYRTPIGFHDAYVAAPSQKAALEAWGSDKNLFASGAAEQVDDPALTAEPVANPGKVIRRARGTAAEHMAALPKDSPRPKRKPEQAEPTISRPRSRKTANRPAPTPAPVPPPKPKPRPDRGPLDRAESQLAEIDRTHREATEAIARQQAELDRKRRKLENDQAREREKAERRVDTAREKYEKAMAIWRAD